MQVLLFKRLKLTKFAGKPIFFLLEPTFFCFNLSCLLVNSIFAPFLLLGPSFLLKPRAQACTPLAAEDELTSSRWARGRELPQERRGEAWMKATAGGGGRGSGWPQKGGFKANRTWENSGNTHKIGRLTKIGGNHQEKIRIFCSKMGKLTSKVGISLANMRI